MTYIYCLWLNCLSSPQCGTTSRRDLKGNTKVKNQARQSCSPAGEQISEAGPVWRSANDRGKALEQTTNERFNI